MEGRIVRLVADPYPPYQYRGAGGTTGLDNDTVVEAFRARGLEARTELLPWDDCVRLLENGDADGLYQMAKTPERERAFLFSDLLRRARTVLYARRGGRVAADPAAAGRFCGAHPTEALFEGLSLGALEGYSYHPAVDGMAPPRKAGFRDHGLLIEGLLNGEVDLALMDLGVAEHLFRELRTDDIARVGTFEMGRDLHVAFNRERGGLAAEFNAGLALIRETGTLGAVYARYRVASHG